MSAINGCGTCIQAHERAVLEGGLSDDAVHDAVRIAGTIYAAATALDAGAVLGGLDAASRSVPSIAQA